MKKSVFILLAMTLPLSAFAASATYTCDSLESQPPAVKGTVSINLSTKTISILENGISKPIFDQKTVCGFSPSSGLSGVNCPFSTQTSDDFLSVDLECDNTSGATSSGLTSGALQIQGGVGTLDCYVFSDPSFQLNLSNCRAN